MTTVTELKIVSLYIDLMEFLIFGLVNLFHFIFCLIIGPLFGFLVYWIVGLDNAIDPKNKKWIRYIKIVSYPLLWSISGIFKGPFALWIDLYI